MKKVLVIVVTYNGMRWLDRCLASVSAGSLQKNGTLPAKKAENAGGLTENGTPPAVQADLYVWDNDSTDGSADFVAANFPQAKLVRSAENLGFAKANNQGFRYALEKDYDYVYLLNQDAWLEAGALEKLVAAAEAQPEYAVLSPLQMTDGYLSLDRNFSRCYRKKNIRFIMAAHWLVPATALRSIGLFNEELFPLYGQDDDWCNRARYHGRKVGVVPEARGVHDRAQREESKEKLILRNYYCGSLVRLCDINHPLWDRFCFVCLFTLVKAVKYRSAQVFKYFHQICRQLPAVRRHRAQSR